MNEDVGKRTRSFRCPAFWRHDLLYEFDLLQKRAGVESDKARTWSLNRDAVGADQIANATGTVSGFEAIGDLSETSCVVKCRNLFRWWAIVS